MPGRPGRLFLVAIPVDDHFAIRFPLALLANVWLSTALAFQTGFVAAVKTGDGLTAALHTPIWVRSRVGANELRLARFVLADAPKAAVGPYLRQGVPPPVIVDEMIETTFHAIVRKFGTVAKRRSS